MDRPIIYSQEQARNFDPMSGWVYNQIGNGYQFQDLTGATGDLIAGFAPSYNANLTVTLGDGRLYSKQPVDASTYGSQPANTTQAWMQAINPGQTLSFTTSGLSAGQSFWALVEVAYVQQDVIPSNDPTSGVLTYYNPSDPTQPYTGPGNAGTPQPTVRNDLAQLNIVYGAAATTGSEVPPSVTSGYSPMYLVNIAYGQTTITSANLFVAGPAVTPNPPAYTAPFISILPQYPNDANLFLNGLGAFAAISTDAAVFTANGNYTPSESGDFLIIGIGGGGGGGAGGGSNSASNGGVGGSGGGGGQIGIVIQTLVKNTAYPVVIGTGGAGGTGAAGTLGTNGTAGNPTQFNSVTIAVGGNLGVRGQISAFTGGTGGPGGTGGGNGGGQGGQISSTTGSAGGAANNNTGGGGGGGGGAGGGTSVAGGNGGNGGSGLLIVMRA